MAAAQQQGLGAGWVGYQPRAPRRERPLSMAHVAMVGGRQALMPIQWGCSRLGLIHVTCNMYSWM